MKKIGIQGIKGSYHDQVAREYFGDCVKINEFLSFDDLADSVVIGVQILVLWPLKILLLVQ